MQIGFVNFNTEEKKRVAKMMQQLQESEAIEELGIGRVRDHFSNTLFPGTSTLQHHAKYFVLLPSLYYQTAYGQKRFSSIAEIDRHIKEAEIQMTRQLAHWKEGEALCKATGITGINTLKDALNDYRKYVKYDPAYIYGGGLTAYGIIPDTNVNRLILEINKKHHSDPHNMKNEEDSDDTASEIQLIKQCSEKYDFFEGTSMDLAMTEEEARFLKDCMERTCSDTLLYYLVNNNQDIPDKIDYYDIGYLLHDLSPENQDIYRKSVLFSKLIHLVDWRFNHAYFKSFGNTTEADKCEEEYQKLYDTHKQVLNNRQDYQYLFDYILPIDKGLTEFCKSCYHAILDGDTDRVDELVKAREYTVKRERSKIGNSAYRNQGRGKPQANIFRWETVRTMINEIRNPQ